GAVDLARRDRPPARPSALSDGKPGVRRTRRDRDVREGKEAAPAARVARSRRVRTGLDRSPEPRLPPSEPPGIALAPVGWNRLACRRPLHDAVFRPRRRRG